MFKFGFSQKLASLCFMAASAAVLLSLNLCAAAAVNSPTLTILDMEEMSQIAGGRTSCKMILTIPGGLHGSCRPNGSPCAHGMNCGTNPHTVIHSQEYCQTAQTGYDGCWCGIEGNGWAMYNCQVCTKVGFGGVCSRHYMGGGGGLIRCSVGNDCVGI